MKYKVLRQDVEGLAEEGNVKGLFRSDCAKVREVWGLLKQLRMSEAHLQRRVREYESNKEEEEKARDKDKESPKITLTTKQLEELTRRYEERIREYQESHEEQLEKLGENMSVVIREANRQIVRQRDRIKMLVRRLAEVGLEVSESDEEKEEELNGKAESPREKTVAVKKEEKKESVEMTDTTWLEGCTLVSTLFVGIINKWLLLLSVKNTATRTIDLVLSRYRQGGTKIGINRHIRKLRLAARVCQCISRIKLLTSHRVNKVQDGIQITAQSSALFNHLLLQSSGYNEQVSMLLGLIIRIGRGEGKGTTVEECLKRCLSLCNLSSIDSTVLSFATK